MNSEWFCGQPAIIETPMIPVREEWQCPKCAIGMMEYTGEKWCTMPYGYHHKCTRCGYLAALSGVHYPRITYRPADSASGGEA